MTTAYRGRSSPQAALKETQRWSKAPGRAVAALHRGPGSRCTMSRAGRAKVGKARRRRLGQPHFLPHAVITPVVAWPRARLLPGSAASGDCGDLMLDHVRESRPVPPGSSTSGQPCPHLFLPPRGLQRTMGHPHGSDPPAAARSLEMAPAQCSRVCGLMDRTSVHVEHAPGPDFSPAPGTGLPAVEWSCPASPGVATFKGGVPSAELKAALKGGLGPAMELLRRGPRSEPAGGQGLWPRGSQVHGRSGCWRAPRDPTSIGFQNSGSPVPPCCVNDSEQDLCLPVPGPAPRPASGPRPGPRAGAGSGLGLQPLWLGPGAGVSE